MRFSTVLFLAASTALFSLTSAAPTGHDLEVRGKCHPDDPKCYDDSPKCHGDKCDDDDYCDGDKCDDYCDDDKCDKCDDDDKCDKCDDDKCDKCDDDKCDKCDDDKCDKCDDDKCDKCDDHKGKKCRHRIKGVDVTYEQHDVDWKKYKFGYILATRGDDYYSPKYEEQYKECHKNDLYCGAYHVAHPTKCSGDDQARYFIENGGDWEEHKKNLHGGVSIGCESDWKDCFGLGPKQLVDWIKAFSDEYYKKTGRYPVISSTYKWWNHCIGDKGHFKDHKLWLVGDDHKPGSLPSNWGHWSIFEYPSPHDNEPGKLKWWSNYGALKDLAS